MRTAAIRAVIGLSTVALVGGLTACGGDKSPPGGAQASTPTVVASTDVWGGSVAQAVAGDHAKVTSIITSASADPHSFEASPPANAADIADASLVVYNGGGYDHWVDDVLASHKGVASVDAYSLLQAPPGEPQPANEHVFYDLNTARAVATKIAEKLAQDDPQHAADYKANAETFNRAPTRSHRPRRPTAPAIRAQRRRHRTRRPLPAGGRRADRQDPPRRLRQCRRTIVS